MYGKTEQQRIWGRVRHERKFSICENNNKQQQKHDACMNEKRESRVRKTRRRGRVSCVYVCVRECAVCACLCTEKVSSKIVSEKFKSERD